MLAIPQRDRREHGRAVLRAEDDRAAGLAVPGHDPLAVVSGRQEQDLSGPGGAESRPSRPRGRAHWRRRAGTGLVRARTTSSADPPSGSRRASAISYSVSGRRSKRLPECLFSQWKMGRVPRLMPAGTAPQGHGVAPGVLARGAIADRDDSIQVVVPLDLPLDRQVEDRGMGRRDRARDGRVVIGGGGAAGREHHHRHDSHVAHHRVSVGIPGRRPSPPCHPGEDRGIRMPWFGSLPGPIGASSPSSSRVAALFASHQGRRLPVSPIRPIIDGLDFRVQDSGSRERSFAPGSLIQITFGKSDLCRVRCADRSPSSASRSVRTADPTKEFDPGDPAWAIDVRNESGSAADRENSVALSLD